MTAEKAVDAADKYFGRTLLRSGRADLRSRPLPGGDGWSASKANELVSELAAKFLSPAGAEVDGAACRAAVFRLGMRARGLLTAQGDPLKPNNSEYLQAEVQSMTSIEHAATQEDITLRRLLLWGFPGELDSLGRDIPG